jgi:hypothetical protein
VLQLQGTTLLELLVRVKGETVSLRMSHALFMAFYKHYKQTLQNGIHEFRSFYRATSINWKNLTSVMYFRVPNNFKSFFIIPGNTCLSVHYNDVTNMLL